MSQVGTSARLERAQDHYWVAERALQASPMKKWLKMLADLLRVEVQTTRQILAANNENQQRPQQRRSQC
jgi:hypothetical protein